jgi:hypothetical protein
VTTIARKPSTGSGPGACCRSKIEDFRDDERAKLSRTTLLTSFRCLLRPGSRTPPRPFSPPGNRTAALPSPWSRDETRSRPTTARLRSGQDACRAARRDRGGVAESTASAFRRASKVDPGGLKGRGVVGEARTRKHRNEVRSAAWSARVERAEGFLGIGGPDSDSRERAEGFRGVCGITPTAVVRSPTNRYVAHLH